MAISKDFLGAVPKVVLDVVVLAFCVVLGLHYFGILGAFAGFCVAIALHE